MKTIKRYFSILLVLSMMLYSASVFPVSAVQKAENNEIAIEVEEDLGGEDELQPMMANQCSYVKFNDKMANTVAEYHGYAGAEAFKQDYGVSSNANMYKNTVTGEIVLITNTGAVINTGLYGGWN